MTQPELGWTGVAGFWIAPDGTERETLEHFNDVRENPELYGYAPEQAARWRTQDREKVIRALVKADYIRVRGHRRYTTFEFHRWDEDVRRRIGDFVRRHGFDAAEVLSLHALDKGESVYDGDAGGLFRFLE